MESELLKPKSNFNYRNGTMTRPVFFSSIVWGAASEVKV